MLFCHLVITVCACTFVTCTLIKINQSINQSINLHEGVRTNFSADFWTFRNFWPQFREICGSI